MIMVVKVSNKIILYNMFNHFIYFLAIPGENKLSKLYSLFFNINIFFVLLKLKSLISSSSHL